MLLIERRVIYLSRPSWRVLFFLLAMLGATACQRVAEDTPSQPRNISFLHYFSFSGTVARTLESIAADFNRQHPDKLLTMTPLDHESFKSSIQDDLRLGNTADVYACWAGQRVHALLDKLTPIDDILPAAQMNTLFPPLLVNAASTYAGRIYLLPLTQHYVGFFYNKSIFARYGLSPPRTWEEFLVLSERLKARGIVPLALGSKSRWPAQFWFDYLLLRTAPLEYRQRLLSGQAAFNDPEVLRVFSLWRELIKRGYFNSHPNELEFDRGAARMVRSGQAAMTLMGTWLIDYYNSPEAQWVEGSDYGLFPFPQIDRQIPRVALGPIDGLVVPQSAKNVPGAKSVLRYFARPEVQARISQASGAIAPSRAVSESVYSPLKQAVYAEIASASAWAFNYDLAAPPDRAEIGLDLFAEFLEFPDQYRMLLNKAEGRQSTSLKHEDY
jgi:ABC-type glycerol-3-phosphate transport system substrate-binding protein